MSDAGGTAVGTPDEPGQTPVYEADQYFPRTERLPPEERKRIYEQYGLVRGFFRLRPDRFRSLQQRLNQARVGDTYDVYLTRGVGIAAVLGFIGALLGAGVVLGLVGMTGRVAIPGISTGLPALPTLAGVVVGGAVGGTLLASLSFGVYYYRPTWLATSHRRGVDLMLPHAIVYMYALAHGGMQPMDIFQELADETDNYGEVAREFETIVRDVEVFGNDLFTALRDARNLTPSDNFEQFLDDVLNVLDAGSDFGDFLQEESEAYLTEARTEQDEFLQTLGVLSEVFIVAFVAAPLFLIVTLVVVSLLGGDSLQMVYLLVYGAIPLGMLGFLVLVDTISRPVTQVSNPDVASAGASTEDLAAPPGAQSHPAYGPYRKQQVWGAMMDILRHPITAIREQPPLFSLVLTVPVTLAVVLTFLLTAGLDLGTLTPSPLNRTIGFAVIPFLIVAVPLSLLHELRLRRRKQLEARFPDVLNVLASANQMGIRLVDALELVSRWSDGVFATELRKTHNDIRWHNDAGTALRALGTRLAVPQVYRTMNLIAKGAHSSGDLSTVLNIASEDTRNRYRLDRRRRQEMFAYVAVVIIGFLVYLGVIVVLNVSYLTPIARLADTGTRDVGRLLSVTSVPVDQYRVLFFHSALIQGVGSGLLAGKLSDNSLLTGLKYSIALVVLALAVFVLI